MTDRPEDLRRRLSGLGSIGQVVNALRAIASGQAAAAGAAREAVAAYATTVAAALAAAAGEHPPAATGAGLLVVIGAAQGFSGAYPARSAAAARALAQGVGLLVIGRRTQAMLADQGLAPLWTEDLPSHPEMIPDLASRTTDALLALAPAHPGPIRALIGPGPEARAIFPPPPRPVQEAANPPLTTLPRPRLVAGLLAEALFAAVARALMDGLEAEARARVEAMARARANLRERRAGLERAFQQARQEQMTTELIELTSARPDA